MLSYGSSALFHSVSGDLLQSLLEVYPAKDAYDIIAIACLKVIRPNITCNRLQTHYDRTFTRIFIRTALFQKTRSVTSFNGLVRMEANPVPHFTKVCSHITITSTKTAM